MRPNDAALSNAVLLQLPKPSKTETTLSSLSWSCQNLRRG